MNHSPISSCHEDLLPSTGKWAQLWLRECTRKVQSANARVLTTERLPNHSESFEVAPRCRGFQSGTVWGLAGKVARHSHNPPRSGFDPTRYPGEGRQPANPSWRALRSASAGDPPSRGPVRGSEGLSVRGEHSGWSFDPGAAEGHRRQE